MKMKLIGGVVLALTIAGCDDTTDNIGIYTESNIGAIFSGILSILFILG